MSITIRIYDLPKQIKKQVLLDCYNALLELGMSKEDARYEIKHMVVCSRLCDVECLIDIHGYHL